MTRGREVKFQKKSRESRLSHVTGERLLEIPCKTSQGNQPAITVCMSRFVPGQCQGPVTFMARNMRYIVQNNNNITIPNVTYSPLCLCNPN